MTPAYKKLTNDFIKYFNLEEVLNCIDQKYSKIYFIGGASRSIILKNFNNFDIDLVIPEISKNTITKLGDQFDIKVNRSYKNISFNFDRLEVQISAFRKDLSNYGRQATITSANTLEEDSNRRDLTINSIYISSEGEVIDFYQGEKDLLNSKLKFLSDPIESIQKDYLRAIRYIRFLSLFKNPKTKYKDIEAIKLLSKNIIDFVKPYKINKEFQKISKMNFPSNSLEFIKSNKEITFLENYL